MKNKFLLAVILMLSILTVSCEKDKPVEPVIPTPVEPVNPNPDPGSSAAVLNSITVDVSSSWTKWNYISLKDAKVIGVGTVGGDDDEWKTRTDWDIAFSRVHIKTNSGTSGDSNGGAQEIGKEETDKDKLFANLLSVPESGYVVDSVFYVLTSMPPKDVKASVNSEIQNWLILGMPIRAVPKVFALKTGNGKYAKIYLKRYKDEEGNNARILMEYAHQPDGTTNVSTK